MTADDPARRWCLPDWRDPAAYPRPGELSPLGWRVEFLRRNPAYREDWQRTDFTAHNALASWICEQWALPRPWPPTSSSLDMVRRARIRNLIDKEADAAWPATLLAYTGPAPSGLDVTGAGAKASKKARVLRGLGWIVGIPGPAKADPRFRREADWSRYLQALDAVETGATMAELGRVLGAQAGDGRGGDREGHRRGVRLIAEARRLAEVMAKDRSTG